MLDEALAYQFVDDGVVGEVIQSQRRYWTEEPVHSAGVDPEKIDAAARMYAKAENAMIIYGEGLLERNDSNLVTLLLNLADLTGNQAGSHLRVLSLKPHCISRGAWDLGIADKEIPRGKVNGLYLLLGEEQGSERLQSWLRGMDFLIVQASYQSPVTSMADIVLPSPTWAEREPGEFISMDRRICESRSVVSPADGALQDREILVRLAKKLGHRLTPR